nr:MAG TPA: hypothetical protein [Caudoviricetes sp.]
MYLVVHCASIYKYIKQKYKYIYNRTQKEKR